jgi:hypothetical protein
MKQSRWKVKIQEKETTEPPHVSILRGTDKWRIDLRTGEFMDHLPDPREVPEDVLDVIEDNRTQLCQAWDEMYPENPV